MVKFTIISCLEGTRRGKNKIFRTLDQKELIIGGGQTSTLNGEVWTNQVRKFNLETKTWIDLTSFSENGFVKARFICREGYLYNFGGRKDDDTRLNVFRRMKIGENNWKKIVRFKFSSTDKGGNLIVVPYN